VLLEFMGYCLSGISPAIGQKALIMLGAGSNGKSVFIDVLKHLAGKNNYSTLSMGKDINNTEQRQQLDGKLFNVSEEAPTNSMVDGSIFIEPGTVIKIPEA
jgi:putative DNA primase/helicase